MFIGHDINTLMYQRQCINVFDFNNTETYAKSMTTLRKNLEKEMASREWNAYVLSDRSGVPQPTIQRFLKGKIGDPRADTVRKLASGLGLTEAYLRGFEEPKTSTSLHELIDKLSEENKLLIEQLANKLVQSASQPASQLASRAEPELGLGLSTVGTVKIGG